MKSAVAARPIIKTHAIFTSFKPVEGIEAIYHNVIDYGWDKSKLIRGLEEQVHDKLLLAARVNWYEITPVPRDE